MMAVGRDGADLLRLPVAVAEDLAGDLVRGRGRDFDQLACGRRQMVDTRADSCRRWSADDRCSGNAGGESSAVVTRNALSICSCLHQRASLRIGAFEERDGVERAGRFVFVLEVDVDVALCGERSEALGEGINLQCRIAAVAAQTVAGVSSRAVWTSGVRRSSLSAMQRAALCWRRMA